MDARLPKAERLSGVTPVAILFRQGKGISAGCIRAKYIKRADDAPSRIVVSVPKRSFKRAVKRNLLKRRMRESFRRQKDILGLSIDIVFVYSSAEVLPYETIFADMTAILTAVHDATNA